VGVDLQAVHAGGPRRQVIIEPAFDRQLDLGAEPPGSEVVEGNRRVGLGLPTVELPGGEAALHPTRNFDCGTLVRTDPLLPPSAPVMEEDPPSPAIESDPNSHWGLLPTPRPALQCLPYQRCECHAPILRDRGERVVIGAVDGYGERSRLAHDRGPAGPGTCPASPRPLPYPHLARIARHN